MRRHRLDDATMGSESEFRGNVVPLTAEGRRGAAAYQFGEFVGAEHEMAIGIDLPREAQRGGAGLKRCWGEGSWFIGDSFDIRRRLVLLRLVGRVGLCDGLGNRGFEL